MYFPQTDIFFYIGLFKLSVFSRKQSTSSLFSPGNNNNNNNNRLSLWRATRAEDYAAITMKQLKISFNS